MSGPYDLPRLLFRPSILRRLQWAWAAVVVLFVVAAIATQWRHLATYDWQPSVSLLALSLGFALVRKFWGGVHWAFLLATIAKIPVRERFWESVQVYFLTNLASYLPGSLWYIPWRMKMNRERGISAAHTSIGSVVESLINVIVNGVLGAPIVMTLAQVAAVIDVRNVVGFLLLGALMVQPPLLRVLFRLMKRLLGRDIAEPHFSYRQILVALGVSLLAALSAGGSIFFLVASLGAPLSPDQFFSLTCSFSLAWVVGFLTPIAPGGLGVREGLLVWLFGSQMPLPVATAAALATRLIFIFEDLFWAGVALLLPRLRRNRA